MRRRNGGKREFDASNEDKRLFPDGGPTKGDVISYYEKIADVMLPHLRDRPLVLRRCPDGIDAECFYQKQVGTHFPDWVGRTKVEKRGGGSQTLVVADSKATLAYLADQAALVLHPWLSRKDRPDHPDRMVIDLDPPGDDFGPVREAARDFRALLEDLGLHPFVATTGSRGLHVVVALDRSADFDAVRRFARSAAAVIAARRPDARTTELRKDKRRGRLFLDVGRNAYAQTAVAPYSLRALPGAPVATPVTWEELSDRSVHARSWTWKNIFRRLGQREDPWSGMARHAASLTHAAERLDALSKDLRT